MRRPKKKIANPTAPNYYENRGWNRCIDAMDRYEKWKAEQSKNQMMGPIDVDNTVDGQGKIL